MEMRRIFLHNSLSTHTTELPRCVLGRHNAFVGVGGNIPHWKLDNRGGGRHLNYGIKFCQHFAVVGEGVCKSHYHIVAVSCGNACRARLDHPDPLG